MAFEVIPNAFELDLPRTAAEVEVWVGSVRVFAVARGVVSEGVQLGADGRYRISISTAR